jgi:hypothetical protein
VPDARSFAFSAKVGCKPLTPLLLGPQTAGARTFLGSKRYTYHFSLSLPRVSISASHHYRGTDRWIQEDFEQRAADVSVTYPEVVQNYRSARTIVVSHTNGQSTTEGLRQAMVYFRSLFDELLDSPKLETTGVTT